jgi:2-hydroxychromene-2-carboxylate isomerase
MVSLEDDAMSGEVEFWFDVGSPYSYLAYKALPRLAQARGARIVWRPMLLGGVFKATGNHSPAEVPAKSAWTMVDMQRWARRIGTTLQPNPHFPVNTLMLMRGAVGYQMRGEADLLRYLDAVFDAMWCKPRNLGDPAEAAAVLVAAGFDPQDFLAMVNDPAVKERLKQNTEEAVARGVFGAPTFFVGDQMYWGQDRLDFVDEALAAGH